MKRFAHTWLRLDECKSEEEKIRILTQYFSATTPVESAWALGLFLGKTPTRWIKLSDLKIWALEMKDISEWLLDESAAMTGDLCEAIALLVSRQAEPNNLRIEEDVFDLIRLNVKSSEQVKKDIIRNCWSSLDSEAILVFNKIVTGGFRSGLSKDILSKALSGLSSVPYSVMRERLSNSFVPNADTYLRLFSEVSPEEIRCMPYPFYRILSWEDSILDIDPKLWMAEWKHEGMRVQIIYRQGQLFAWNEHMERIPIDQFPELAKAFSFQQKDFVIEGELFVSDEVQGISVKEFLGTKHTQSVSKAIVSEGLLVFRVRDLLEWEGIDIRSHTFEERRQMLESFIGLGKGLIQISPIIQDLSWESLNGIRTTQMEKGLEGLLLRRKDSLYPCVANEVYGYLWKTEPYLLKAVLMYVQRSSVGKSNKYSEFVFGLWHQGELKSFARCDSGLSAEEFQELQEFIQSHTIDKIGPVRTVVAQLVFEIIFEGVQISKRHKIGMLVRLPRILRWRKDLTIEDADSVEELRGMVF
jgi:DNA ligase-1